MQKPIPKYIIVVAIIIAAIVCGYFIIKTKSVTEQASVIKIPVPGQIGSQTTLMCSTANTTPVIQLVSPNGGEMYHAGQQITVKWSSCNIPAGTLVYIGMLNGGHDMGSVTPNGTTNDGSEIITLGSIPAGTNYRIGISTNGPTGVSDVSDAAFTIQ